MGNFRQVSFWYYMYDMLAEDLQQEWNIETVALCPRTPDDETDCNTKLQTKLQPDKHFNLLLEPMFEKSRIRETLTLNVCG